MHGQGDKGCGGVCYQSEFQSVFHRFCRKQGYGLVFWVGRLGNANEPRRTKREWEEDL
jgi:hypothetical protein